MLYIIINHYSIVIYFYFETNLDIFLLLGLTSSVFIVSEIKKLIERQYQRRLTRAPRKQMAFV